MALRDGRAAISRAGGGAGPARRGLTSVQGLAAVLAEERKPRSRLAEELREPWDSLHSTALPPPSPPSRTNGHLWMGTAWGRGCPQLPYTVPTCPGGLPSLALAEGAAGAAGGPAAGRLHAERQGLPQLQLRLLGRGEEAQPPSPSTSLSSARGRARDTVGTVTGPRMGLCPPLCIPLTLLRSGGGLLLREWGRRSGRGCPWLSALRQAW